jgi:general secretion pathway protein F
LQVACADNLNYLVTTSMTIVRTSPPKSLLSTGPDALARVRLKVQGQGHVEWLELAEASEAMAVRHAVAQGFRVLAIETVAAPQRRINKARFPLLLFSQELLALLDAGLNLNEALTTLHTKERQPAAREVLASVLRLLREGRSFSDALALSPQHFPDVYVATVRASERTGDMPKALSRYIAYQLQFESVRKKLVSAAIYPAMLLVVGGLVTLFLLGYVVPRFSVVYESSGRDLPWMSAALLQFGKWVAAHSQLALLSLGGVCALVVWGASQARGRAWLVQQVLRLPWLNAKAQEFQLARFYRAVSLLLAAGIALPRAMGMVNGLLSPAQQGRLAQARLAVEQGQSLSAALMATGLASPVAESLIKVGERSGQMADMLERTARFADDDFARWVDWASRLLEPVLMTVIGLVVGTVVVLMYMPIFELAGSLQ